MPPATNLSTDVRTCTENCEDCHALCVETIHHCLGMGGQHADPEHIGLMMDCAEICALSADYMRRSSPRHVLSCGICAEICEACAQHCERLAASDQLMSQCAKLCRRCAGSCREMSAGE